VKTKRDTKDEETDLPARTPRKGNILRALVRGELKRNLGGKRQEKKRAQPQPRRLLGMRKKGPYRPKRGEKKKKPRPGKDHGLHKKSA